MSLKNSLLILSFFVLLASPVFAKDIVQDEAKDMPVDEAMPESSLWDSAAEIGAPEEVVPPVVEEPVFVPPVVEEPVNVEPPAPKIPEAKSKGKAPEAAHSPAGEGTNLTYDQQLEAFKKERAKSTAPGITAEQLEAFKKDRAKQKGSSITPEQLEAFKKDRANQP